MAVGSRLGSVILWNGVNKLQLLREGSSCTYALIQSTPFDEKILARGAVPHHVLCLAHAQIQTLRHPISCILVLLIGRPIRPNILVILGIQLTSSGCNLTMR